MTCLVYTCTEAYIGQVTFYKVPENTCLTGHPVPGYFVGGPGPEVGVVGVEVDLGDVREEVQLKLDILKVDLRDVREEVQLKLDILKVDLRDVREEVQLKLDILKGDLGDVREEVQLKLDILTK